jgi:hypothetical protein
MASLCRSGFTLCFAFPRASADFFLRGHTLTILPASYNNRVGCSEDRVKVFAAIIGRNLIRLVLVFVAVALVTYLMVWETSRRPQLRDCAVMGIDGRWEQGSCPGQQASW